MNPKSLDVFRASHGRWMRVDAVKKDGTARRFRCRTYSDSEYPLRAGRNAIVVIDRKVGYRTINLDAVSEIASNKQTYNF